MSDIDDTIVEASNVNQSLEKQQGRTLEAGSGIVYPPDVWYLIAQYVPVEDLCRFALICKDSSRVLQSVLFWKKLYKW